MRIANIICNFLSLAFLCLLTCCDTIVRNFYGIKEINGFNKAEYDSFISRLPNDVEYTSLIGKSSQFNNMVSLVGDTITLQHLHQPIQLLYFQNDTLVSHHVNCTAPAKWRGLDWNYENRFGTFPPESPIPRGDCPLPFDVVEKAYGLADSKSDFVLVIFWTTAFERISHDAISTAFKNLVQFNKQGETTVYLINNDEIMADFGR